MATQNIINTSLSGQSGSGSFAGTVSPIFTTPTLGVASATSINKVALTAPATAATLTIANGKTLTMSNTVTFTGTDSSSIAFGAGGTLAYNSGYTSWTPVVTFTTPGDLSVSYGAQVGAYNKIGSMYTIVFTLIFTPTFTTASGNLTITGLPVASNATTGNIAVGSCYTSGMTWPTLYTSLALQITEGSQFIGLIASKTAATATNFAATNFTTGVAVTIIGSIVYLI